jgi:hypothetical protein
MSLKLAVRVSDAMELTSIKSGILGLHYKTQGEFNLRPY